MNKKPILLAAIGGVLLAVIGLLFVVPNAPATPSPLPLAMAPFLADQDLPYAEHVFDADSGTTVLLESGTRIAIPAGILIDTSGTPVVGEVHLRTRELDTPGKMLQAGVPMQTLDSAYYRSAAMIEILADQGEVPLQCAPGAQFEVRLASDVMGEAPDYKLYHFPRNPGAQWAEAGAFARTDNVTRDSSLVQLEHQRRDLEAQLPQRPITATEDDFVFQLTGHPELARHAKALEGMDWKWVPQPGDDPASPPLDLLRRPWDEVKVTRIRKGLHRFDFAMAYQEGELDREETATLFGESLLNGRAFRRQMQAFEAAQQEHEAFYAEYEAQQARLRMQRSMFYTFESNGFGLLNIDKLEREDELMLVDATLTMDGAPLALSEEDVLWMVAEEANTVLRFSPRDFGHLPLPNGAYSLYLALGTSEFAHLGSDDTAALRPTNREERSRPAVQFNLVPYPKSEFTTLISPPPSGEVS